MPFPVVMKKLLPCIVFVLVLAPSGYGQAWRTVSPGDSVKLPGDLYFRKAYRIQWWYLTGHVFDASGREFGYELTFFAAGVQQRAYASEFGIDYLYLVHFAVSDVAADRFHHHSSAEGGAFDIAGADPKGLRVWVDRYSLTGTLGKMRISAEAKDFALELSLVPKKQPVLNGKQGYARKAEASPEIASLYFSLTNMETTGRLRIGEQTYRVSGKSWFDRELASRALTENEAGWNWYAIQLDDGRELMLYEIRKKSGELDRNSSGTLVYSNGAYRHLNKRDFSVEALDHYVSDHTGARYPSRWSVSVPSEGLALVVTPLIKDQEFTDSSVIRKTYWEGTCNVEGSASGRAYVEMTGYADD